MKNENDINSKIETTCSLLNGLETELVDIPNRKAVAIDNADSAALIALSRRAHDLPIEIQMTKISLERLRVLRKEATLPALDDEIERLYSPIPAAQKAFDEADEALKNARYAHSDAIQQRADARQTVAEMKAGITRLKNEKTAS